MSDKKELNQEELQKVSGGESLPRYCNSCGKLTTPKVVMRYTGGGNCFVTVCSDCENPYVDLQL